MSAVCILTPVVIAAWPAFSAAVAAAATSLGYTIVEEGIKQSQTGKTVDTGEREVTLEIEQSEIVTNQLGRDQCIKVTRGGCDRDVLAGRAREGLGLRDRAGPFGRGIARPRRGIEPARRSKIHPPAAAGRNSRPAVHDRGGRSGRKPGHPAQSPALGRMSGRKAKG